MKAEGIAEKLLSESSKLKAGPKGRPTVVLKVIAKSGAERRNPKGIAPGYGPQSGKLKAGPKAESRW